METSQAIAAALLDLWVICFDHVHFMENCKKSDSEEYKN